MEFNKDKYDYIVVGTGPAGAVVANRLSKDGRNSVLVVEAGPNKNDDPAIMNNGMLGNKIAEYFWPGTLKQQPELNNRLITLGQGRLSGGGSSINGQLYIRPTPMMLEKWCEAAGEQWSIDSVTRFYMELEKFNGTHVSTDVHGYEGNMEICQVNPEPTPLMEKFADALTKASGIELIDDYNDYRTPIGHFHRIQIYQRSNGNRGTASVMFLGEDVATQEGFGVEGRNLRIMYETTATKILFNDSKEAIGIEYMRDGKCGRAYARRKVIVSAGIRSAKLLQLSGIGDSDELEKLGIDVVADNPNVGKGLINDVSLMITMSVDPNDIGDISGRNTDYQNGAFLPSAVDGADMSHRGIEFVTMLHGDKITILLLLIDTKSRGQISIQSKDPLRFVLSDERTLTDEADVEALKAALRKYIKGTVEVLREDNPAYELLFPTVDVIDDDEKLDAYIQNNAGQGYHEQCELRMGKREDGAVVDGYGNVYGVKNLAVADASTIPYRMDGNTSGCSFLIGYVVSKHILEEQE